MRLGETSLEALIAALQQNPALARKRDVQPVARALGAQANGIRNGDDAAAVVDGDGYLLLAAEGMIPQFVHSDPFFAGFCAVMTNVSDIAAMGGRPLAVVDILFRSDDRALEAEVLSGLAAGASHFAVPVVGGHTGLSPGGVHLAAAIAGRARTLITSFDARPADVVVAAIDLRGAYRGITDQFDAASAADPARLRAQLALLPALAEAGLVHAGKDISMAGLVGTLLMLLETSGCGARLDLGAVPAPPGSAEDPARWLRCFPSFGYLLVTRPAHTQRVCEGFAALGVDAAPVAEITASTLLVLQYDRRLLPFWDLNETPLLGFTP